MADAHEIRIDRTLLHPWLNYKLFLLLDSCGKKGMYLIITEGFRTKEYQDQLYAKGRTAAGSIVTNAKGSTYSSQHMWGIAFDIALNYDVDGDGEITDDTYNITGIRAVAKIAKSLGLGWGGDWTSIVDTPHFYLKGWGSTTEELKEEYGTPDVFIATWTKEVNAVKGLNLWKNVTRTKKILRIPHGNKVKVMYRKLWYAKVVYRDKTGYVYKKYLQ